MEQEREQCELIQIKAFALSTTWRPEAGRLSTMSGKKRAEACSATKKQRTNEQ